MVAPTLLQVPGTRQGIITIPPPLTIVVDDTSQADPSDAGGGGADVADLDLDVLHAAGAVDAGQGAAALGQLQVGVVAGQGRDEAENVRGERLLAQPKGADRRRQQHAVGDAVDHQPGPRERVLRLELGALGHGEVGEVWVVVQFQGAVDGQRVLEIVLVQQHLRRREVRVHEPCDGHGHGELCGLGRRFEFGRVRQAPGHVEVVPHGDEPVVVVKGRVVAGPGRHAACDHHGVEKRLGEHVVVEERSRLSAELPHAGGFADGRRAEGFDLDGDSGHLARRLQAGRVVDIVPERQLPGLSGIRRWATHVHPSREDRKQSHGSRAVRQFRRGTVCLEVGGVVRV